MRLTDAMPRVRPVPHAGSQYGAVEASAVTRALLELDAGANRATPSLGALNQRSETPVAGASLLSVSDIPGVTASQPPSHWSWMHIVSAALQTCVHDG